MSFPNPQGGPNGDDGNEGMNDNDNLAKAIPDPSDDDSEDNVIINPGEETPPPPLAILELNEDDIFRPDDAPDASIYAFLNSVADPYTGPLHPQNAAYIEDIYPRAGDDIDPHGFYAALRQRDPHRTLYRHLDLFASAAASAPHELIADILSRRWHASGPVGLDDIRRSVITRPLEHVDAWYKTWTRVLNWPQLADWELEGDRIDPTVLQLVAYVTDGIERIRRAEPRLRWAPGRPAEPEGLDGQPRRPVTVATWVEHVFDAVSLAYLRVGQRFHNVSGAAGAAAGVAAADAEYWALPAETRLVAQLIATEKLVERMLARRHVEDVHLARQVHVLDRDECVQTAFCLLYPAHGAACRFVEREVRNIQHVANRTAAYRYFKRNRIGRPWRRLHLVMADGDGGSGNDNDSDSAWGGASLRGDTAGNGDGGGGGVVGGVGSGCSTADRDIDAATVRSVAEHLDALAGTPILPLQVRPTLPSDFDDDDRCLICLDGWTKDQLVLETRCGEQQNAAKGHFFHFLCIFRRWDAETSTGFQCDMCRQTVAAQPGALFGYTTAHPPPTMADLQQLRINYWHTLLWIDDHPDEELYFDMACVRMDYFRRLHHNRDRRSFIGFGGRPYNWHPLPLWDLYVEEGLPDTHPPYRYDAETDSLVCVNPLDRPPALLEIPRE